MKEREQRADEWIKTVPQIDYDAIVDGLRAFGNRKRRSLCSRSQNDFPIGNSFFAQLGHCPFLTQRGPTNASAINPYDCRDFHGVAKLMDRDDGTFV